MAVVIAAVTSNKGKTVHVPVEQETHEVRTSSLTQQPDGRVTWVAIDGASGVSGVLPHDDPRAVRALRELH